MTILPAQFPITGNNLVGTLPLTINGVTAGNLLTLTVSWTLGSGGGSPPSVPTDGNGTWIAAINPAGINNGFGRLNGVSIFYCQNANAGTHIVTFTNPGSAGLSNWATLTEWKGAATSSVLDTATPNTSSGAVNTQTLTVSTLGPVSNTNSLILCGLVLDPNVGVANAAIQMPIGFNETLVSNNDNSDIGAEHSWFSSYSVIGTQSVTWTWGDNTTPMVFLGSVAVFQSVPPTGATLAWSAPYARTAVDIFQRSNGAIGANYTQVPSFTGVLNITSNLVSVNNLANSAMYAYTAIGFSNDQYSEVTLGTPQSTTGAGYGVAVRASTSTQSGYSLIGNAVGWTLYLWNAGTQSILGSDAGTIFSNGDTLKLVIKGNKLLCYKNNIVFFTIINPILTTGSPALYYQSTDASGGNIIKWDGGTV